MNDSTLAHLDAEGLEQKAEEFRSKSARVYREIYFREFEKARSDLVGALAIWPELVVSPDQEERLRGLVSCVLSGSYVQMLKHDAADQVAS